MDSTPPDDPLYAKAYMPDEITRDLARRMHYAAYQWQEVAPVDQARRWQRHYYALRDRIILGNRKLVFRAIRLKSYIGLPTDDLIAECDLVLIRAVAAFNPWPGIRFSTYVFTCLMRALARLQRRLAANRTMTSLSSTMAADHASTGTRVSSLWEPLVPYFHDDATLLTEREKLILVRRYQLTGEVKKPTLEAVAQELGLSKERVRQLQTAAVLKLRQALLGTDDSR
jgi:RNA polymerase sigma factor (sigma-70 family)